jgi:AcrR family transcriptional regulator
MSEASSTRKKMISGAADLLSRRGVSGTSLRDVVDYTGTPRGSLGHHFPGGKVQMLEEAIAFAADGVAIPLQLAMTDKGVVLGLRTFIGWWRNVLVNSEFEAGCAVLAVAVASLTGTESSLDQPEKLRAQTHEVFVRWQSILADALGREGVSPKDSRRLAVLAVAAIEGTVAMCRAARSLEALDDVQQELETILEARIALAQC